MLKIFNTLSNKKEIFRTIKNNQVKLYVCGITPYDYCHIGHGRTFLVFDVIIRYLTQIGYNVTYVRNITDIDDKIIKKSLKQKKSIKKVSSKYIEEMKKDFSKLNLIIPFKEPLVSEHIDRVIRMIKNLLSTNYAYISSYGDVVFSIQKDQNYGCLSNQITKNLKKKNDIDDRNYQKNVEDFVLWKKSKNNEPYWSSPWGNGRPGWHIECSAINDFYFGKKIDIHGGGIDLLFPHHENENSQSTCFNDSRIYSNYWIHSGMVLLKNKKMSKSKKHCVYLKEILKAHHPESIRLFFLFTHYKSPIYYDETTSLKTSFFSLNKLYRSLDLNDFCMNFPTSKKEEAKERSLFFKKKFFNAMNDDFNTPKALFVLFKISREINVQYFNKNYFFSYYLSKTLKQLGNLLGILFQNPKDFFKNKLNHKEYQHEKLINFLIEQRNRLRSFKNWGKADIIRKKLLKLKVIVEDNRKKTKWRYKHNFG